MTKDSSGPKLLDHWLAPEGSGRPQACLATSFTFDADFVEQDCLPRFLGLQGNRGDGESTIADLLEEEEALSEVNVSILCDRSCSPQARSLRWSVLPVTIRGGLLHAKVTVLIWESHARVLIGSANLTAAGYRRQYEAMFALDITSSSRIPMSVVSDLVTELRLIVDAAPGSADRGPKRRAGATLDLLVARASDVGLPATGSNRMKMAIVPARPGLSALEGMAAVRGGSARPRRMLAMSPFWDGDGAAVTPMMGLLATKGKVDATFVVPLDTTPLGSIVRAPHDLVAKATSHRCRPQVRGFKAPYDDDENRRLHAKCLIVESADWTSVLIGSSNLTVAGLGLNPHRGHWEVNLALGCPTESDEAAQLRALVTAGDAIAPDEYLWEPEPDEDDSAPAPVPDGFLDCLLSIANPPYVTFALDAKGLPDRWQVTAGDDVIANSETWVNQGSKPAIVAEVSDNPLPQNVVVHWTDGDVNRKADWPVNVDDDSKLPPPQELRDLPAELLIAVLSSTRPLREAFERELARLGQPAGADAAPELDPLKRFQDSGLLLPRTRRASAALWALGRRLSRPLFNIEALDWRLDGPIGPRALAEAWVRETDRGLLLAGEAEFLLGELALTIARVDWVEAVGRCDFTEVRVRVQVILAFLTSCREKVAGVSTSTGNLRSYVDAAFAEASR